MGSKYCSNKIIQFLTDDASDSVNLYNSHKELRSILQDAGFYVLHCMLCCRNMTSCPQTMGSMHIYQPHQLTGSCQPLAYTPPVSMTLQQKVYRLHLIEFERPVRRELPAYIDVNDPRWSGDPRVRPCIQPAVTALSHCTNTNGIGLPFYSSGGGHSVSDTGSLVWQPTVSSSVPLISTNGAAMHNNSVCDSLPVSSSPVKNVCNDSSSITHESTPSLPVKQENFSDVFVKSEPVDVANIKSESVEVTNIKSEPTDVTNTTSAPVARHTFLHNVSWPTRSSGIQKLSQAKNGSN